MTLHWCCDTATSEVVNALSVKSIILGLERSILKACFTTESLVDADGLNVDRTGGNEVEVDAGCRGGDGVSAARLHDIIGTDVLDGRCAAEDTAESDGTHLVERRRRRSDGHYPAALDFLEEVKIRIWGIFFIFPVQQLS